MTFFEKLKQERIIPVVKIQDASKAPALARALLDAGKKVAVASGSYRFIVDRCLEAAGLSDIPIKVTASEVKKCKPDPEGYLRAAELLGADPKDCLVFEDTPVGVKAAQAAGMRVFRFYDTLRDGPNI